MESSLQCGSDGGDRQPPATAEGLGTHLQQRCCLSALEFGSSEQALDPLHLCRIVASSDQLLAAEVAEFGERPETPRAQGAGYT